MSDQPLHRAQEAIDDANAAAEKIPRTQLGGDGATEPDDGDDSEPEPGPEVSGTT